MLGQTEYQHVSGTRCVSDMSEIPSIFMEKFVQYPSIIHSIQGKYAPDNSVHTSQSKEKKEDYIAMEKLTQLQIAYLDIALHSNRWSSSTHARSMQSILKEVHDQDEFQIYNVDENTPTSYGWMTRIPHWTDYAASYYAYPFAESVVKRIHEQLFALEDEELWRRNGMRVYEELLQWGGSRDGWECISALLNDDALLSSKHESISCIL